MKNKIHVSELMIPLNLEQLDTGDFLATSSILPDLLAQGRSAGEAVEIAQDVARKLIESYQEHGDPLPRALQKQILHHSKKSMALIPVAVNL